MRQGGFDLRVRYSKAEIDAKLEALEQRTVYYGIGVPGTIGFGVAPARKEKYEAIGAVPYDGHDVDESPNRGLYLHTASGSTLCHIPKHYYKYVGNIATLSDYPQDGYVLDRSFINGGVELDGVFIFITHGSNNSGKLSARKGYAPLSTGTANNPINALSTAPANNLGGIYKAAKSCDASAFATPMWHFTMLARLAKAHGEASTSTAVCAFVDVLPKHPKGNNNNALKDYNDTSVTFTSAGNATYPNCALTGSGVPYPKTTHNGQQNGVADLNGNIWTACSGMTYRARTGATGISGTTAIALTAHGYAVGDKIAFGGTPAVGSTFDTVVYTVASVVDADNFTIDVALARDILATNGIYTGKTFYILKESVDITAMQDDSTTAGTGAFDMSLYDQVDLSDLINPSTKDQWKKLGNGTEQVFDFNTDRNTNAYKRASLGIPRLLGQSAGGTTEYGNDGIYSHLRHDCVPMAGGSWDYTSNAGPGTFNLNNNRTNSNNNVGVRDCISKPEATMVETGNIGVYCPAISEINGEVGLLSNDVENQTGATKRTGNLYEASFSIENLHAAFIDARKGKRKKKATLAFEKNLGAEIYALHQELKAGTYAPKPYITFKVYEPKERIIYAPHFRDLVVQHAIYRTIYPIFDRTFIDHSYACRKGKGTHAASAYTQKEMRKYDGDLYYVKLDVKKFFYCIDREVLRGFFEKKIKDARFVDVMMQFTDMGTPKGIPIGNLLSQLYALIYMNPVDHFIKRELKAKSYVRYVDDMVVIGVSRERAVQIKDGVESFLGRVLKMEYSHWMISKIKRGINFVGYRTWKSVKFVRKHSMYKFRKAMKRSQIESMASLVWHASGTATLRYYRKLLIEDGILTKLSKRSQLCLSM